MGFSFPFDRQCDLAGLHKPVGEYRFHPTRKWRFDWAFVAQKLAVEVEGGIWTGGRHSRGAGFEKDLEKYAEAMVLGWRVLRVTPKQIADGRALTLVDRILRRAA
jgi:very-short-patch-repair endonuclease